LSFTTANPLFIGYSIAIYDKPLLPVVPFLLSCLFCIFVPMKFYEKYPQLKEKGFLSKVLTDTVFSTMSLEDQQVPKPKVIEIVQSLLAEQELKGRQFFSNQSH
jgi:hypothetical protein